jgi:hypothetical protein
MNMQRRTFDRLVSWMGLVLTAVLVMAGALLSWASSYVNDQVHSQLAAQKIFFPKAGSDGLKALPAADRAAVEKYAGQQLLTGDQAGVFADHYIAVHLKEIGGGLTYSELSAKSLANPNDQKLAGQVQTVFRGETLRGLLLNAFAFGKMGTIAGIAAIVSFVGAALMLALTALGMWHSTRVPPDQRILDGSHERIPAPQTT